MPIYCNCNYDSNNEIDIEYLCIPASTVLDINRYQKKINIILALLYTRKL